MGHDGDPDAVDAALERLSDLALIWGSSFMFIKIAVRGGVTPPVLAAGTGASTTLALGMCTGRKMRKQKVSALCGASSRDAIAMLGPVLYMASTKILVGFLGILLAYGLVGPMANYLEFAARDESQFVKVLKTCLMASIQGYPPQIAIEFGRKGLYSTDRPSFSELETHAITGCDAAMTAQRRLHRDQQHVEIARMDHVAQPQ